MVTATLVYVPAGKAIDKKYAEHVARAIAEVVRERFGNSQTRAAKALGVSQPHLSHLIAARGRGPGLSVLLRLREYTGRSIDELLGLPPPAGDELMTRLRAALDTEVARIRRDARMQVEQANHEAAAERASRRAARRGRDTG